MKEIKQWKEIIDELDYAYQPIVSLDTGKTIGFEALLRGVDKTELKTIDTFFDKAYENNILHIVEFALRKKAIIKFLKYKNPANIKLFLNLDNRIINSKKFDKGKTKKFINSLAIENSFIVFEISEKHEINSYKNFKELFDHYAKQDFQIAIDDYGTGFSSMKLLYHTDPDYIKIDRFFIKDVDTDIKKQIFLRKILEVSHLLGHLVVAEGVETTKEFLFCKELGFDMVQGFLIEKPNIDIKNLPDYYDLSSIYPSKREKTENIDIISNIEVFPSIHYKSLFSEVFHILKHSKNHNFLVVVNDNDTPLGVLEDRTLKEYLYSPYGNELLSKKRICDKTDEFLTQCRTTNSNESIETILNIFSYSDDFSSIIIKEKGRYKGVLSAQKLLDIVHKKQLLDARDQNPLTKLGGNSTIINYIQKCMDATTPYLHIYYDLDNFKPYNDKYGFRNGDRIILLFADILRSFCNNDDFMIGHIGGDDFFMSVSIGTRTLEATLELVEKIIEKFSRDVVAFYKKDDIKQGFIESKDRNGNVNKYKFLTVSAAVLEVNGKSIKFKNEYADILAEIKKTAKKSSTHYSISTLL
ncbi:MAG: GGDEF domain-containing protein [Sulfurospirillaceae bacterium]|nr:GGDEF domain-containing protein [Sulfurospirillaceae bacterium]